MFYSETESDSDNDLVMCGKPSQTKAKEIGIDEKKTTTTVAQLQSNNSEREDGTRNGKVLSQARKEIVSMDSTKQLRETQPETHETMEIKKLLVSKGKGDLLDEMETAKGTNGERYKLERNPEMGKVTIKNTKDEMKTSKTLLEKEGEIQNATKHDFHENTKRGAVSRLLEEVQGDKPALQRKQIYLKSQKSQEASTQEPFSLGETSDMKTFSIATTPSVSSNELTASKLANDVSSTVPTNSKADTKASCSTTIASLSTSSSVTTNLANDVSSNMPTNHESNTKSTASSVSTNRISGTILANDESSTVSTNAVPSIAVENPSSMATEKKQSNSPVQSMTSSSSTSKAGLSTSKAGSSTSKAGSSTSKTSTATLSNENPFIALTNGSLGMQTNRFVRGIEWTKSDSSSHRKKKQDKQATENNNNSLKVPKMVNTAKKEESNAGQTSRDKLIQDKLGGLVSRDLSKSRDQPDRAIATEKQSTLQALSKDTNKDAKLSSKASRDLTKSRGPQEKHIVSESQSSAQPQPNDVKPVPKQRDRLRVKQDSQEHVDGMCDVMHNVYPVFLVHVFLSIYITSS